MTKIINHSANGRKYLLVGVEKTGKTPKIIGGELWNCGPYEFSVIELPPGQWSIVGMGDKLTEEQCLQIFQMIIIENYLKIGWGMKPETTLILQEVK